MSLQPDVSCIECKCGCGVMTCIVDDRSKFYVSAPAQYYCEMCGAIASIDKHGTIVWTKDDKPITTNINFNS